MVLPQISVETQWGKGSVHRGKNLGTGCCRDGYTNRAEIITLNICISSTKIFVNFNLSPHPVLS